MNKAHKFQFLLFTSTLYRFLSDTGVATPNPDTISLISVPHCICFIVVFKLCSLYSWGILHLIKSAFLSIQSMPLLCSWQLMSLAEVTTGQENLLLFNEMKGVGGRTKAFQMCRAKKIEISIFGYKLAMIYGAFTKLKYFYSRPKRKVKVTFKVATDIWLLNP